ncbi:mCG115707, partial [Mus musculus]
KDWWSCRSCWSRADATIGGPYGEPTPPPSSELSAVSGCRQGKFTVSETCDPRSLGRTSDKIEVSIKLPGSRHKVTQEFGKDLG